MNGAIASAFDATNGVVLQAGSEIDLDYTPYGANDVQFAIAALIAISVIILSSLFIRFWSSRILDDAESEHARAVTQGLRHRDPHKLRVSVDDDVDELRSEIRGLVDGDFDQDVPSITGALGEVHSVWKERRRAASQAVKGELPALSRALSLDAVLYLVVGLIVHVSISTWGSLVSRNQKPPSPGQIADQIVTIVSGVFDTLLSIASSFPFAGEIWLFGFLAISESFRFVYNNPVAVGSVLLVGSLVIWILDRAVADDVEPKLYRSRPRAVFGILAVLLSTFLVGVVVATIASTVHSTLGNFATGALVGVAVGALVFVQAVKPHAGRTRRRIVEWQERRAEATEAPDVDVSADIDTSSTTRFPILRLATSIVLTVVGLSIAGTIAYGTIAVSPSLFGSVAGLLASLPVLWVMARYELRSSYDRLTAAYEQADEDGVGPTGTVGYIATRKVFGLVGVFAGLILPVYIFEVLTTGKLVAVVGVATTQSSVQIKFTAGLLFFGLLAFAIVQTKPAWGDFASALRLSLDRKGLRLALLTRGFPVLVVLLSVPMAWGSGFFSLPQSLMIGLLAGVATKAFFWLKTRAESAYYNRDDEPRKPGRVWIEAVVVEDARGREIGVVSLNGEYIAAPIDPVDPTEDDLPAGGVDELVDQVVADTKSLFESVEIEPSVFGYYYDRLHDGRVDFAAVRTEYLGTISRAIDSELESAGRDGIELERLDEIMSDQYDPDLYQKKRYEKQKKPDGIAIYGDRVKKS